MRLLRPLIVPTRMGMYQKFQGCGEIQTSAFRKRQVLVERLIVVHGSKMRWRLKFYAASALSNSIEGRKYRGRVSRNERKSMVERYVKKYQEMNSGKFPTVSCAVKEVGGSYYVVRGIIQELEYNCNRSSVSAGDPDIVEVCPSEIPGKRISPIHVGHDKSKGVETQPFQLTDEPTGSSASEKNATIKIAHVLKLESREYQPKSPSEESEVSERDLDKLHREDAEPQRKSSFWKSLKSFANDFLGLWKGY